MEAVKPLASSIVEYVNRLFKKGQYMDSFGIKIFSMSYALAMIAHHQHFQTDSGFHHSKLNDLYDNVISEMDDLIEQIIGQMDKKIMNKDIIQINVNDYKGINGVLKYLDELIAELRKMPSDRADILAVRDNFVNSLNKTRFLLKAYK